MAYDRYDTRRDPRERWRSDEYSSRDRNYGNRDERGFFERAGDEIASWFGDDEAERRRRQDYRQDERGHSGRARDLDRERESRREFDQPRSRGDRDRDDDRWSRSRDDDRGMFSTASYRGFGGEGMEDDGRMWSTPRSTEGRSYRPLAGDYGRGGLDRDRGRSAWDRDEYRRTSFAGSMDRSQLHDPHYSEWRQRQLDEIDRDYDEYRREHQSKFESDFGDWRTKRQGKRQMLGSVREHMEVVGSDDEHIGTVDRVAGERVILTKSDEDAGGVHHSLPCTLVDRIEDQKVILDCSAEKARERWRDESRGRALFEREDQGEAGPHTLNRSFSGTY
jgi:hypothetical protein